MQLTATNLTKEYKLGESVFTAVKGADLTVNSGEFVCITGRSGSGKSTLLNMIAGLLSPTAGKVTLDGKEIWKQNDAQASLARNARIGYISQGYSLLSGLDVLDNVRLPYYLHKRQVGAAEKALGLLEQVGIAHLKKAYPATLSGGEARRVSIARALVNSPQIVIADEPTGDLDWQTTQEIMRLFRQIAENGTAVLVVTHETDTASFGSRFYTMEAGFLSKQSEF